MFKVLHWNRKAAVSNPIKPSRELRDPTRYEALGDRLVEQRSTKRSDSRRVIEADPSTVVQNCR